MRRVGHGEKKLRTMFDLPKVTNDLPNHSVRSECSVCGENRGLTAVLQEKGSFCFHGLQRKGRS